VDSIEFDVTADDYVTLNLQFAKTSPFMRRRALVSRASTAFLLFSLVFVLLLVIGRDLVSGLLAASASATVGWLIWPWSWKRQIRKVSLSALKDSAEDLCLQHRLAIEPDGLREQTDKNDTLTRWAGIQSIEQTVDHAFIYVGPMLGFVVPKRGQRDQVEAFIAELSARRGEFDTSDRSSNQGIERTASGSINQ